MSEEPFSAYRHSGKFGIHGPLLAVLAALILGFPLGLVYAYGIRWIPFIYVNFFLTLGYGFVIGLMTGYLMKFAQVRNAPVAAFSGVAAGCIAWYLAWSAHIFAVFKGAPILCPPQSMLVAIQQLYEEGSWSLHGGNVTGIPLAIVWVIEGGMIVVTTAIVTYGAVAQVPFCEQSQCWLDQEKKINTLEMFSDPAQVAALKAGDLGPLTRARPRAPDSAAFTRLTLKHSPHCQTFCTVRLENVVLSTDKDGKIKEKVDGLTKDLKLPASMLDLITKFETFKVAIPAAVPP